MPNQTDDLELQDISGLTARVTFDLPFCLYLEDGVYEINRGDWVASVHLERVVQTHLDPRLGIERATTELIRDRYGRLRFSKVVVELPGRPIIEAELRRQALAGNLESQDGAVQVRLTENDIISGYGDVAFEEAVNTVNRLIEVYRYVMDQFHIRRIPSQEIFTADIQWYLNGEFQGGTWYAAIGRGITMAPESPAPERQQRLHSWLSTSDAIPLPFELFQDARDRLDRGDDRLAVIDARTALEVFLDQILLTYLTVSAFTLEEAGKVLDVDVDHHDIQEIEEALQRSSINRKLGHALHQAMNLDIHNGSPQLWQKWLWAKQLREKGAHRGQNVEHDEAVEAVNCMGEILSRMREALSNAAWMRCGPDTEDVLEIV